MDLGHKVDGTGRKSTWKILYIASDADYHTGDDREVDPRGKGGKSELKEKTQKEKEHKRSKAGPEDLV